MNRRKLTIQQRRDDDRSIAIRVILGREKGYAVAAELGVRPAVVSRAIRRTLRRMPAEVQARLPVHSYIARMKWMRNDIEFRSKLIESF